MSIKNDDYQIYSENEVSAIISHLSKDYIINVVEDTISRINPYNNRLPNIVMSMETNYKNIINAYPDARETVLNERNDAYREIINIICRHYNLNFDYSVVSDYYSAAYYLYEFLVSGCIDNIVSFFMIYIKRECDNIYESLNLAELKKNKDTNTLYNKKFYNNQNMAIINANLEYVVDSLCNMAIPYELIVNTIYPAEVANFILQLTRPTIDFFSTYFKTIITNPDYRPMMITRMRLVIQSDEVVATPTF